VPLVCNRRIVLCVSSSPPPPRYHHYHRYHRYWLLVTGYCLMVSGLCYSVASVKHLVFGWVSSSCTQLLVILFFFMVINSMWCKQHWKRKGKITKTNMISKPDIIDMWESFQASNTSLYKFFECDRKVYSRWRQRFIKAGLMKRSCTRKRRKKDPDKPFNQAVYAREYQRKFRLMYPERVKRYNLNYWRRCLSRD